MRSLIKTCMIPICLAIPVQAANYALVIGIDDYQTQPDLAGAVNDARLISNALKEFGVRDLRLLLDGEANYDAIRAGWQEMLALAEPGDRIILTYSGHGARLPDENGDEAGPSQPDDVTDEMLVLAAFNPQTPEGQREKIVDDELHQWFLAAKDKDIQIIFVADSCFSGTVTRGGRARFLEGLMGMEPEVQRKPISALPDTEEETIENVTFLAGAREAEPVIEVMIDGRYHGALSYAFAKALESMTGDLDGDGTLGRDELNTFIPRTARSFNGARYLPEINPSRGPDFMVLTPDPQAAADADALLALNQTDEDLSALDRFPVAAYPGTYWEKSSGNIIDATGEIIGFDIEQARLSEVNDKFELLNLVREGMMRRGTDIELLVNGEAWHRELREGETVRVTLDEVGARYLTMFNLANNGEVQLMFPINAAEREPLQKNADFGFETVVLPPFGSDELVAIITEKEPEALRQALKWAQPAGDFLPILSRMLAEGEATFGHTSFVTRANDEGG